MDHPRQGTALTRPFAPEFNDEGGDHDEFLRRIIGEGQRSGRPDRLFQIRSVASAINIAHWGSPNEFPSVLNVGSLPCPTPVDLDTKPFFLE